MQATAPRFRTDLLAAANDVGFHDLMAERLRQAPWLVLSAAAHTVALLVLWLLLPPDAPRRVENAVHIQPPVTNDVLPVPPPPPPQPRPEQPIEPTVVEPLTVDERPDENPSEHDHVDERAVVQSAFLSTGSNTAVGLGGNAGGPYGGRGPGGRRGSGGGQGPAALEAALQWLRTHQDADGRWDCDQFTKHDDPAKPRCDGAGNAVHDVGVTGLALLAFLGDGSTMRSGPDRDTVRRGVLWLRSQQRADGLFGTPSSSAFIYDHAIAAYAMCEAYGLSSYRLLQDSAQRGIDYLEAHRNPYGVWRYQPRDGDGDTSVTGWCILAYCAAKHFGLQVDSAALDASAVWLDQVSDASGRHGYSRVNEPSSRKPGDHAARFPHEHGEAMTAVGLFCRYFLGQKPATTPVMNAAADLLVQKPPVWDARAGKVDHYYWYYGSYALFQMGGPRWVAWQKQLAPALLTHQHRDRASPNLFGSWDPVGVWGEDGGRVYSTAILALTLQVNFRYTRLVR